MPTLDGDFGRRTTEMLLVDQTPLSTANLLFAVKAFSFSLLIGKEDSADQIRHSATSHAINNTCVREYD